MIKITLFFRSRLCNIISCLLCFVYIASSLSVSEFHTNNAAVQTVQSIALIKKASLLDYLIIFVALLVSL